ncbi:DoxX-like family protein [Herbaspirillum sp. RV1423]|uniref:DoxX-like family protein n=1 Tax=Herbaspirillum sp. RV1423 TaxID=1443993 RepID=UPI0009E08CF1|nr:DoxX-like family protein [Herbaspirillum sp. RV1423]
MSQDDRETSLRRLYWITRTGIAFIWIWTAITSWFFYPHAISLEWLRTLGLTYQTEQIFSSACLLDAGLGLASLFFASRRLWQVQCMVVITYSVAIAIWLPVFLVHPFGAITKNIAVLACLFYLIVMERR